MEPIVIQVLAGAALALIGFYTGTEVERNIVKKIHEKDKEFAVNRMERKLLTEIDAITKLNHKQGEELDRAQELYRNGSQRLEMYRGTITRYLMANGWKEECLTTAPETMFFKTEHGNRYNAAQAFELELEYTPKKKGRKK